MAPAILKNETPNAVYLRQLGPSLRRRSDAGFTAVINGQLKRVPFDAVARDVARTCRELADRGVASGMRIGLIGANSYEWLLCDFALCTLGCVSLAFPADHAPERVRDAVEEHPLDLLIADAGTAERLGDFGAHFAVASPRGIIGGRARKRGAAASSDAHSIVYSSGTAGAQKLLLVSRSGSEHLIESFVQAFGFTSEDSLVIFMPLASYQQRLMAYAAATVGMSSVIVPPHLVFRALAEFRPTVVIGPPLLFETLLANAGSRLAEALGGRVRTLICGMAPLKRSLIAEYAHHGLALREVYGLTECGMVTASTPAATRPGSVGRPLPGTRIVQSDDGEIVVHKSHPLCLGYVAGQEFSDTRFVGDALHTGDLGHVDADGFWYLSGRKKNTIVLASGQKLLPEPIERMLEESPAVKRAVVLGDPAQPFPVAVVDAGPSPAPATLSAIHSWVAVVNRRVPDWARIAGTIVASTPFSREDGTLNAVFKVNRSRVRELYADRTAEP